MRLDQRFLRLRSEITEVELNNFWDAFILDAIERYGLAYGGGTKGFASAWGRGSASETHREDVRTWLSSRADVLSVVIGPLVDAWHGGENALQHGGQSRSLRSLDGAKARSSLAWSLCD